MTIETLAIFCFVGAVLLTGILIASCVIGAQNAKDPYNDGPFA